MKYLYLLLFFFVSSNSFSQLPPPAAIHADKENLPLIEEVVESTHYEYYFEHYMDTIVQQYAARYNWDSKKIKKVKSELKYSPNILSSGSNAYARTSKSELEEIRDYNLALSKKQLKNLDSKHSDLILSNLINTLNIHCRKYIE